MMITKPSRTPGFSTSLTLTREANLHQAGNTMTTTAACPLPECDFRGESLDTHLEKSHSLIHTGAHPLTVRALLSTPYWNHAPFAEVLAADDAVTVAEATEFPLDTRQYRLARYRLEKYLKTPTQAPLTLGTDVHNQIKTYVRKYDEIERNREYDVTLEPLLHEIADATESVKAQWLRHLLPPLPAPEASADEWQQYHDTLQARLVTAAKINHVVTTELAEAVATKRRLYIETQILLDANVEIGLPPESGYVPERVVRDDVDTALLDRD